LDNKEHQEKQLKYFLELLLKWNSTHNLVSKTQQKNLQEHIEDSLCVSGHLGNAVVDVGSGGGFPGIPLAITNPDSKFYLVESNNKKASFLLNTKNLLGLDNTKIINKRMEDVDLEEIPPGSDFITRALGQAKDTIKLVEVFLQDTSARLHLMKTEDQFKEEKMPEGFCVKKIENISTKQKDKQRILVTIGKN
jgi:16S rRNA (guanine527-N7)-methyltransferase